MNIILASSSNSRKKQLLALNRPFTIIAPDIDETPLPHESAHALVLRLSAQKAEAVASQCPNSLIIAGDQVCDMAGQIIGKPLTRQNAIKQLQASRGQTVRFYSGLAVLNTATTQLDTIMVPTDVTFRDLSDHDIIAYVDAVNPVQCAGSFNVEGLGISLFEKIVSEDPTALIGLPMISVITFLQKNNLKLIG